MFIDGKDYDNAETALFAIIRAAFIAGWKSAEDKKIIDIDKRKNKID